MSLEARIFDDQDAPTGRALQDAPDLFLSMALSHARKSPQRFPLLSGVDPSNLTQFNGSDRERLKVEWLMLESLAIGPQERAKWQALFAALTKAESFQGIQFVGA